MTLIIFIVALWLASVWAAITINEWIDTKE